MSELTQMELQDIARGYFKNLLIHGNELIFKIENDLMGEISADRHKEREFWATDAIEKYQTLINLDHSGEAAKLYLPDTDYTMKKAGFVPDRSSDSHDILNQYLVRAQIEHRRVLFAKLKRDYAKISPHDPLFLGMIDDTLPPMPEFGLSAPNISVTIHELVAKFQAAKCDKWANKTVLDFKRVLSLFSEWFGQNVDIKSLSTVDIGEYRDALVKMPKIAKSKGKPGYESLRSAILNPLDVELITPQTAEKYLNLTRSFLNWCCDEGYIEKVPGKKIAVDYIVKEKGRLPFVTDQLAQIFSSPIWTGCHSAARRSKLGHIVIKNEYFWMPLIGIYTGMRAGEIIQLRNQDIKTFEGILYIDVNEDNQKKLKTKYSNRRIPIHPFLKEIGFAEFLQKRAVKGPDVRVFEGLVISPKGDPSSAYSKTFSRYLKDIGVKTKKVSFHSFRHTFSDACDNASIITPQRYAMMGHADSSAASQYGTGASVPVLFKAICAISYDFEADLRNSLIGDQTKLSLAAA